MAAVYPAGPEPIIKHLIFSGEFMTYDLVCENN
jgi:hypothetical protein